MHYRIYNLCPEMPYPASFFRDQVMYFDIQDHSPPSFDQIFQFLEDAANFVHANIDKRHIAIHCKAGKGRTGTMCCAWLLFSQKAHNAGEALDLFAERRTDHLKDLKALQDEGLLPDSPEPGAENSSPDGSPAGSPSNRRTSSASRS